MSDLSEKSARELLTESAGDKYLSVKAVSCYNDMFASVEARDARADCINAAIDRDERLTAKLREIRQFCEQYTYTGQKPGLLSAIVNIIGSDA